MKMKLILVIGIFSVFLCAHGWAVPISGDGALGSFEGTFDFNAVGDASANITISLTNTSPAANGGFLTAFVFNNPDDAIGAVLSTSTSTLPSFSTWLFGDNSINAAPFGQFDIGAAIKGSFEGGGAPSKGIGVGETATFTFYITGSGLLDLVVEDFLNELSTPTGDGQGTQSFVARFRGFKGDGSDKVPGTVPVPSTMYLLGTGLIGLAGFRGRKKINVS